MAETAAPPPTGRRTIVVVTASNEKQAAAVEAELAARVRPGALLLLSGFRSVDLPTVRAAFEGHFEMPAVPTTRRDDGWLMLACRRRAGSPIDGRALSDAAVEG